MTTEEQKQYSRERMRRWRAANREKARETQRLWRAENPERLSGYSKKYWKEGKTWNQTHAKEYNAHHRKYRQKLRLETLSHYCKGPPRCVCVGLKCWHEGPCQVIDIKVLDLDHVNDNGAEERKMIFGTNYRGGGYRFLIWLKSQGYPEGYQVFCVNCNAYKERSKYED